MLALLNLALLITIPSAARAETHTWLCQCYENDQAKGGPVMTVSLDLTLTLAEAETRALKTCQEAGNPPPQPKLARCVEHVSAALSKPAPQPVTGKKFESLSKEDQRQVKEAYKKLLRAHEKKEYGTMLKQVDAIKAHLDEYFDTSSYESIAQRGLATDEAGCRTTGGTWSTWTKYDGAHHVQNCRWPAKDAGKSCQDGKDCSTGLCEFHSATKSATCTKFGTAEGCHAWMKGGVVQSEMCVD